MTHPLQPGTVRARMLCVAAAALVALLVLPTGARAARDPVATGITDLHMKKGFVRKLTNSGITVAPVGNSSVTGNKVGLQAKGGKLDPTNASGYVEQTGGFKLSRGARGVPITNLTVNTAKTAVYAVIAKAKMQLGTLEALTSAREGFGANFKAVKLVLTEKATRRISNRLGLKDRQRLEPGRVLSNSYTAVQPKTATLLAQGSATLVANTATLGKLAAKGVELPGGITALAPATKAAATTFQFPISGGTLAPDGSAGTVETNGGLQIFKKAEPFSPTMKLSKIYVDFATKAATVEIEILPTPPFPGSVGRSSIADITLPAGAVTANPATREITVKGAEARVQALPASTINNVFNQPAPEPPPSSNLVVGDPLGTFSLIAQAQ